MSKKLRCRRHSISIHPRLDSHFTFSTTGRLFCVYRLKMMKAMEDSHENQIFCCQCRTLISPNPVNMCVACVRKEVDITEGIPKQSIMYLCKGCDRYLSPPDQWVVCATESRELLSLCLKKLKGLSRVRLVTAAFEWTEPHSRRIRVKLTIQKEVMAGAVLEQ
uniref:60S ribosomal export protein NMD3 n=1 Tax=Strigamia maritima TaxID=126957 RepID=T1ITQ0_STRMM